jgi:hypothetical protein
MVIAPSGVLLAVGAFAAGGGGLLEARGFGGALDKGSNGGVLRGCRVVAAAVGDWAAVEQRNFVRAKARVYVEALQRFKHLQRSVPLSLFLSLSPFFSSLSLSLYLRVYPSLLLFLSTPFPACPSNLRLTAALTRWSGHPTRRP